MSMEMIRLAGPNHNSQASIEYVLDQSLSLASQYLITVHFAIKAQAIRGMVGGPVVATAT